MWNESEMKVKSQPGLRIGNEDGLWRMREVVAEPGHGLAGLHVDLGHRVGEMPAVHRIQPPTR